MKIKCEYCGSMFSDTLEKCPNCGATSSNMTRTADHTPKTIEELKQWYHDRNLPPFETTRFFIGINYKAPKAFGIYEENGEFIVYKNKDTGERAIRYRGTDEAYAVNELYLKLKSEILNQKSRNLGTSRGSSYSSSGVSAGARNEFKGCCLTSLFSMIGVVLVSAIAISKLVQTGFFAALISLVICGVILLLIKNTELGKFMTKRWWTMLVLYGLVAVITFIAIKPYFNASYYMYNNDVYVSYHDDYYVYDGYDYSPIDDYLVPDVIINNPADYEYTLSNLENWNSGFTSFYDSGYYDDHFDSSSSSYSSSDSDYDWDSGDSWDSGGSDWGSDW